MKVDSKMLNAPAKRDPPIHPIPLAVKIIPVSSLRGREALDAKGKEQIGSQHILC